MKLNTVLVPQEEVSLPDVRARSHSRIVFCLAVLVIGLLVCFTQWRAGAWRAAYGAYPDEPSHFMGGLMVHDFLISGSHSPLAFAERYYLFQPFFAIGHWPPVFYVFEGLWMLIAGYSHPAMIVFSGLLTGLTALLLFAATRRRAGDWFSIGIAAIFVSIPSVQWSSSVVMADMCAALLCLAAILAIGSFLETGTWRSAALAALFATLALLTKYVSIFVILAPVLLILIERRWTVLRNLRTWLAAGTIAALCIPWMVWSRRFMLIGFDTPTGSLGSRVAQAMQAIHIDLGSVLTVCALAAGVWGIVRWRQLSTTERLCLLSFPCLAAFVMLSPAPDVERRYLMGALPELLVVLALAVESLTRKSKSRYWLAVSAALLFTLSAFSQNRIGQPTDASRDVARYLVMQKNPVAILVPSEREGPLIAELASAEPVRSRVLLIRPSKLFARMNWMGTHYQSLVPDEAAMASVLERYPIDIIVTSESTQGPILPHERMISEMLRSSQCWELNRSFNDSEAVWKIYTRRKNATLDMNALALIVRTRLPSVP